MIHVKNKKAPAFAEALRQSGYGPLDDELLEELLLEEELLELLLLEPPPPETPPPPQPLKSTAPATASAPPDSLIKKLRLSISFSRSIALLSS